MAAELRFESRTLETRGMNHTQNLLPGHQLCCLGRGQIQTPLETQGHHLLKKLWNWRIRLLCVCSCFVAVLRQYLTMHPRLVLNSWQSSCLSLMVPATMPGLDWLLRTLLLQTLLKPTGGWPQGLSRGHRHQVCDLHIYTLIF